MRKLAIIVCNYNKRNYLESCLNSIVVDKSIAYEIFIVDNNSEDDSRKFINEIESSNIHGIFNKENLGGSGGFNTGMRAVLGKSYDYIMLLDNDVKLEKNAIMELIGFLNENGDYGMVGSLILSMDNPQIVQELGANIDFENYYIRPFFKGTKNEKLPDIIECDYVPACSLLIRGEALSKVGLMNEENFIYWDDIEWGYQFKLNGYKVGAYSKSIVWHKMGAAIRENTFATYYFWRNRIKFFINYIDEKNIQSFCERLFDEAFRAIFMCSYVGKHSQGITIFQAINDALNGIVGRAKSDRIRKIEKVHSKLEDAFKDVNNIKLIYKTDSPMIINKVNNELSKLNKTLIKDNEDDVYKVIEVHDHILEIKVFDSNIIYIDQFLNLAYTTEDKDKLNQFDSMYELARNIYLPMLIDKIYKYRNIRMNL